MSYIESWVLHLDNDQGLLLVLVAYLGTQTKKYGKMGYLVEAKVQFWCYIRRMSTKSWQVVWCSGLTEDHHGSALRIVAAHAPQLAKCHGKLGVDRKPPTGPKAAMGYKVVCVVDNRYYSLYQPELEYRLGVRLKEPARSAHRGGYFSYSTLRQAQDSLPFWKEECYGKVTVLAIVECTISGRIIPYSGRTVPEKCVSTYLCSVQVLEVHLLEGDDC